MKILVYLFTLLLISGTNAYAQELKGNNYKIELGNEKKANPSVSKEYFNVSNDINSDQETVQGNSFTLTFPYSKEYGSFPIGISLSSDVLDFGTIESGEPILRNHSLDIYSPSKRGYSVYIFQDTPLTSETKLQIPNTTCDSGSCSSILSDNWNLPLTYGYGYTCENKEVCNDSFQNGFYRRLASVSNDEAPVSLLEGAGNSKTNMLFKINTAGTQEKTSYSNTLYYILSSNY